jgi:hypothetical protein
LEKYVTDFGKITLILGKEVRSLPHASFYFFHFFYYLNSMTQTAPAPSLDFSISAEQVENITSDIIAQELLVNDEVASLKPEEQTYENIVVRLARIENELSGNLSSIN